MSPCSIRWSEPLAFTCTTRPGRALVAAVPGGFGCCHRVSSFVAVWVQVPSALMSTTASTTALPSSRPSCAITEDDVADTALGECSEDARRLLDTQTRNKRAQDGEARRRQQQTSNAKQQLLLGGQDLAPVTRAVEAADAAHGAVDVARRRSVSQMLSSETGRAGSIPTTNSRSLPAVRRADPAG